MIRYWIFAGLCCIACSAFADDGVVLSPEEAIKVAHQCSRISPGPLQGTWQPTASQIKKLEMELPAEFRRASQAQTRFLEIKNLTEEESERRLAHYVRQYAGLTVGTRNIIYVNAVQIEPAEEPWRTKAVLICDGGPSAFGVEYNPSTGAFSNFAFNGAI